MWGYRTYYWYFCSINEELLFVTVAIVAGNLAPKQTKTHFLTEIPFLCPSIVLFSSLSSCFRAGVGWTSTRALWLTYFISFCRRTVQLVLLLHATKITEKSSHKCPTCLQFKLQQKR